METKTINNMKDGYGYVSVFVISLRHNLATSGESRRYVVAFTRFAGGCIFVYLKRV